MLLYFFLITIVTVCGVKTENIRLDCRSRENSKLDDFITIKEAKTVKEDGRCLSMSHITLHLGSRVLKKGFLADLPNLEHLVIHQVAAIEPGAFQNLPKLTYIEIVWSSLREIKTGVFSNTSLAYIILNFNQIDTIATEAFDNMPQLKLLELRSNHLSNWNSNWLSNSPNVEEVFFSFNQIHRLPDGCLENVQNATKLDFSHNSISYVGKKVLGDASGVKYFDLRENNIEEFGDGVLEGVESLETLMLSTNGIKCFSGNFDNIFVAKKTLVDKNPVNCNCVDKIGEWEKKHPGHQVETDEECVPNERYDTY